MKRSRTSRTTVRRFCGFILLGLILAPAPSPAAGQPLPGDTEMRARRATFKAKKFFVDNNKIEQTTRKRDRKPAAAMAESRVWRDRSARAAKKSMTKLIKKQDFTPLPDPTASAPNYTAEWS